MSLYSNAWDLENSPKWAGKVSLSSGPFFLGTHHSVGGWMADLHLRFSQHIREQMAEGPTQLCLWKICCFTSAGKNVVLRGCLLLSGPIRTFLLELYPLEAEAEELSWSLALLLTSCINWTRYFPCPSLSFLICQKAFIQAFTKY